MAFLFAGQTGHWYLRADWPSFLQFLPPGRSWPGTDLIDVSLSATWGRKCARERKQMERISYCIHEWTSLRPSAWHA